MKVIIATGIYPPEIGGPSEYARQLFETMSIQNHDAVVVTYGGLKKFTTGFRHLLYFGKLCIDAIDADYIIALDTFSVALPSLIFSKILGKKMVVRVAGDFLWESYVDRTGEQILLSEFYSSPRKYSLKESIIFLMTRFILNHCDGVVFSTEWQRKIMENPYELKKEKTYIIENFYPVAEYSDQPQSEKKIFLSPSRDKIIKNKKNLAEAFRRISDNYSGVELDTKVVSREVLSEKISRSYAVIIASLSEVSPNMVMDALQYCVPVIVTKDMGISDRLKDIAVFVDPMSIVSIEKGIETLLNPEIYKNYRDKIKENKFSHSWNEIAQEFLDVYEKIK